MKKNRYYVPTVIINRYYRIHSQGLAVGDRILSVNGESLLGKDRHRAVQLVKVSTTVSATIVRDYKRLTLFGENRYLATIIKMNSLQESASLVSIQVSRIHGIQHVTQYKTGELMRR